MTDFDVCICGSGPCGATAGYYLATLSKAAGRPLRIGLFDKAKFPRDKFCGDAWCAPALDILEDMGVLQELEKRGVVSETLVGGFVSPSGYSFIANDKGATEKNMSTRAYAIKRIICDEAIAMKAKEVGCTLVEETLVEDAVLDEVNGIWTVRIADGRKYTCKILIAADGAASNLARKLGIVLTPTDGVAARQYIKGGTHNFKADGVLLYPEYTLPGYVAIFRHYDDSIDLGAYLLPGGAAKEEDIAEIYSTKIRSDPFVSRALGPKWEPLERVKVASLRLGGVKQSYAERFFIVGDAAGQVDPLTGEGIHTGMIAGRICAQTIMEMFAKNDFSIKYGKKYHDRWWKEFGSDFPMSATAGRVVFKAPYLMDAVPIAAAAKGSGKAATSFFADFGAVMTGVKPKTTFVLPWVAWPLVKATVGVLLGRVFNLNRGYFDDPYTSEKALKESNRTTAWDAQCLIDPKVPVGSEESEEARLDKVIQAMFAWGAPTDKSFAPVLVCFGTEYGFSNELASKLCDSLFATGKFRPRMIDLAHYSIIDWTKESLVLFICSTAGDGDPPVETRDFFNRFVDNAAEQVLPEGSSCVFAVLALGDSAYPKFCAAGRRLARGLSTKRGFTPLLKDLVCQDMDGDKPSVYEKWIDRVVKASVDLLTSQNKMFKHNKTPKSGDEEETNDYLIDIAKQSSGLLVKEKRATRADPFPAKIKSLTKLTQHPPCSMYDDKWHIVVDCTGAGKLLQYSPGDALGVLPRNDPNEVARLMERLFTRKALSKSEREQVFEELSTRKNLKDGTEAFYRLVMNANAPPVEDMESLWLSDVLDDAHFPGATDLQQGKQIIAAMRELQPRFYSIASSPVADGEEIHLCVAAVRYEVRNRPTGGVCSTYLCDRTQPGDTVQVFIQRNPDFRLPSAENNQPILMVGPGTGVAPFRSFARQQKALGLDLSQSMLFFGCRYETGDFLYAKEWTEVKYKLVTAFSRDQEEKIYVQHRIMSHGKEIYEKFIQTKSPVFICGDGWKMARDVEEALVEITMQYGTPVSRTEAEKLVKSLLHLDVWVV